MSKLKANSSSFSTRLGEGVGTKPTAKRPAAGHGGFSGATQVTEKPQSSVTTYAKPAQSDAHSSSKK
jgi:hypothetical protein